MTSWRLSLTGILFRHFQFKDPLLSGDFTSDAERWLAALHWCIRTSQ
jgi:hypothetical protein